MKWGSIHPQPDRYDFSEADRYVAEMATVCKHLGGEPPARSVAELRAYWRLIADVPGTPAAVLRLHLLTGGQRRAKRVGDGALNRGGGNDAAGDEVVRDRRARGDKVSRTARSSMRSYQICKKPMSA